jgi:hypothetical protein
VSTKKHAAKAKDRVANCSATSTKHKLTVEEKQAAKVMDARANKDRRQNDRRQKESTVTVEHRTTERRAKVNRRRQIDPTTCERDYSTEEVEFMSALDDYKRRSGRMFPTCSEILEVLKSIGYEKRADVPTVGLLPEPVSLAAVSSEQAV